MDSEGTIKVSSRPSHSTFVYEGKEKLKNREVVEMHGLGEAITNTVRAAEMLCSLGYAIVNKFETLTITDDSQLDRPIRKSKVIITLMRTQDFFKNYEEYEKNRSSNRRSID